MTSRVNPRGARSSRSRLTLGFSLVELVVVIAILGVLAAMALPRMQQYVWRAKRNEAYINLNGIYKSQNAYRAATGHYGETFEEIGFQIEGAQTIDANTIESQYYTYTLETFAVDGVAKANYSAVATGDLDPSDAMLDIVMIESGVVIVE